MDRTRIWLGYKLLCPLRAKEITDTTAAKTPAVFPKSSVARIMAAMGVFADPARAATKPRTLKKTGSRLNNEAKAKPAVAPTKKVGVRTPPVPPKARVIPVAKDFSVKAYKETPPP